MTGSDMRRFHNSRLYPAIKIVHLASAAPMFAPAVMDFHKKPGVRDDRRWPQAIHRAPSVSRRLIARANGRFPMAEHRLRSNGKSRCAATNLHQLTTANFQRRTHRGIVRRCWPMSDRSVLASPFPRVTLLMRPEKQCRTSR